MNARMPMSCPIGYFLCLKLGHTWSPTNLIQLHVCYRCGQESFRVGLGR